MNYIYDLVFNYVDWNERLEFYEWKKEDILTFVQKIPVFKINSIQMEEVINYRVQFDKEFLKLIYNQTFTEEGVIPYSFLLMDGERAISFQLDSLGKVILNSCLLLDEEEVVLEESSDFELTLLDYNVLEKYPTNSFFTRRERNIQKYLLNELENLYHNKNYDEIDYLYNELYSDKKDVEEKYNFLINDIKNNYNEKYNQIYDIILLTQ